LPSSTRKSRLKPDYRLNSQILSKPFRKIADTEKGFTTTFYSRFSMLTFASKNIGLSLFLLAICTSVSAQEISWQNDLATANSLAAKQDKLVWLHFTADWCRPCKALETFVFSSPLLEHTIDKTVVPVKVDVDLHPDLVSEYGISGVPADVVLTPAGRILTKRNSPSTIDDYTAMFEGLGKMLAGLDHDNTGAAKDLAELKDQMQPRRKAGQNDFVPDAPSHKAPRIATDSAMLAKNGSRVLENPFFQPTATQPQGSAAAAEKGSVVITNDFVPNQSRNSSLMPMSPPNRVAQADINALIAPDQQQRSAAAPGNAPQQRETGNAAMAKSESQSITNQYFQREQMASQQANVTPREQMASQQANVTPREQMASQQANVTPREQSAPQTGNQFEPGNAFPADNAHQASMAHSDTIQIDRSMFGLHGKCPVTLITESRWVDGDSKFGCVHRGRTYLFTSKEHLQMFQADPDKYSPLLAGYDPVIYHERGELVEGLEVHGVFMGQRPDQRIVLFSSAETRARFEDRNNTKDYIETVRQAMLSSQHATGSEMR
jgi:thiol-disulfide isomerase/thioredoxin/YHS domain-containing protein